MERILLINVSWPFGSHLTSVRLYNKDITVPFRGYSKMRTCYVCCDEEHDSFKFAFDTNPEYIDVPMLPSFVTNVVCESINN